MLMNKKPNVEPLFFNVYRSVKWDMLLKLLVSLHTTHDDGIRTKLWIRFDFMPHLVWSKLPFAAFCGLDVAAASACGWQLIRKTNIIILGKNRLVAKGQ